MKSFLSTVGEIIWKETPTLFAWLAFFGILTFDSLLEFIKKNPLIYLLIFCASLFLFGLFLYRNYKSILFVKAKRDVDESFKTTKTNRTKEFTDILLQNVPSQKILNEAVTIVKKKAEEIASDAYILSINYYIEVNSQVLEKTIQSYFYSPLRECKYQYYPLTGRIEVEEGIKENTYETHVEPRVQDFPLWRESVKKAIEASASENNKSESVKVQITVPSNELHIVMYFKNKNSTARKSYELHENKLLLGEKVIAQFT